MPPDDTEIEKRLWEAADELRANSKLKPSEYSVPVLGCWERTYPVPIRNKLEASEFCQYIQI